MERVEFTFGHRRHGPVPVRFTFHHYDENRENNKFVIEDLLYLWPKQIPRGNLVIAHPKCHKEHHAVQKHVHGTGASQPGLGV